MLALTLARRELRCGLSGLRLLFICLLLGVSALAGVGSLASSIGAALSSQGQAILGGDVAFTVAQREADAFVAWAKASPQAADAPVQVPGEPEEASRAARGAGGIPVDRATWRQIRESAAVVGFDEAELDAWTQRCTASV